MKESSIELDEQYQVAFEQWCERNSFDEDDAAVKEAFDSMMDQDW